MLSCPSQLIYGRSALSKPLTLLGEIETQIDCSSHGISNAT